MLRRPGDQLDGLVQRLSPAGMQAVECLETAQHPKHITGLLDSNVVAQDRLVRKAWKLSWVLKDWAPDSMLDTYENERRPVAEHNLVRSLDPMGSRRRAQDELRFDLGDRLPHAWIDRPAGRISSLDLLGPGLTQLSVDQSSPQLTNPSHVPPITGHRLEPLAAAAVGADQPGGILLRPDGVIWEPPAQAALSAA